MVEMSLVTDDSGEFLGFQFGECPLNYGYDPTRFRRRGSKRHLDLGTYTHGSYVSVIFANPNPTSKYDQSTQRA
jgi:hypothetical protein